MWLVANITIEGNFYMVSFHMLVHNIDRVLVTTI